MCGFEARKVQLVESHIHPLGSCGLTSAMLMRMLGIKSSEGLHRQQTQILGRFEYPASRQQQFCYCTRVRTYKPQASNS